MDKSDQLKYLTAGSIAGVVSRTCIAPLERVKIFYQVSQKPTQQLTSQQIISQQLTTKSITQPQMKNIINQPKGIISLLAKMYREEGVRGYFKGNGANCLKVVPNLGIRFFAFENYKKLLLRPNQTNLTPSRKLMTGSIAGLTALSFTHPLDLIRTRLTVQTHQQYYRGINDAIKQIFVKDRIRGLYRGFGTAAMSVAPFSAVNFASYETLKEFGDQHIQNSQIWISACYGAGAGAISSTILYPMDLIKRRMMVQGYGGRGLRYWNTWDAVKKIVTREGPTALYRGLIASYIKVIPTVSLTLVDV